jgi:hypothetical protein
MADIELSACADEVQGAAAIRFTLTNTGREALVFLRGQLPWSEGVFELPMTAKLLEFPATELGQRHRIVDYVGKVRLEPGETISGALLLGRRFVDFDRHRASHSLIVFWHWLPRVQDGISPEVRAGWVIFPSAPAL